MEKTATRGFRNRTAPYKPEEACTVTVGVSLSYPLKRRLDKAAGECGVSRSQLVRDLLEFALEKVNQAEEQHV